MKNNIKVLRSIVSPGSISKIVLRDYDFKNKLECKLIKAWGSNDIYEIKEGKSKYILKLYSIRKCWTYNKNHYLFELELQKFLYEQKISVPRPLINNYNSLISKIQTPEYNKYYAIYSYLDGDLWSHNEKTDERLYILGQNLAKLHNTARNYKSSSNYRRALDLDFLVSKPYKRIQSFIKMNPNLEIYLTRISEHVDQLKTDFKNINLNDLHYGIIHGDAHPGNHFYLKLNKKTSFFDFELCGYGYYIYDLATFKWGLCLSHKKEFINYNMKKFLDGYLSINNLMSSELGLINIFARVRHLFILGSSIILYPETSQLYNEDLFFRYLETIKILGSPCFTVLS